MRRMSKGRGNVLFTISSICLLGARTTLPSTFVNNTLPSGSNRVRFFRHELDKGSKLATDDWLLIRIHPPLQTTCKVAGVIRQLTEILWRYCKCNARYKLCAVRLLAIGWTKDPNSQQEITEFTAALVQDLSDGFVLETCYVKRQKMIDALD
jgi:hypothetical protein